MSPTSDKIESLARKHGVNALEALEFFLERASIREFEGGLSRDEAESEALKDLEIYIPLWIALKGEPGPADEVEGGEMMRLVIGNLRLSSALPERCLP